MTDDCGARLAGGSAMNQLGLLTLDLLSFVV